MLGLYEQFHEELIEFEEPFDDGEKLYTGVYLIYEARWQHQDIGSAKILERVGVVLKSLLEGTFH